MENNLGQPEASPTALLRKVGAVVGGIAIWAAEKLLYTSFDVISSAAAPLDDDPHRRGDPLGSRLKDLWSL